MRRKKTVWTQKPKPIKYEIDPQQISWFLYAVRFFMFSVSVFVCVPVLVYKSQWKTKGIYSLFLKMKYN